MKEINNLESLFTEWANDYKKIKEVCKKTDFIVLKALKTILLCFRPFGILNIFLYYFYSCVRVILFKKPYRSCFKPIAKEFQNIQDILVISSLVILIILLFYFHMNIPCWILVLIFWRLGEILVYQLSIIFLGEGNGIKTSDFPRSIVLFLINVSEVILIYAIFYLSYGVIGYCKNQVIQKPFKALYFSIITISTTGFGDIIPINRCGRILVFSEITIGILLLVIFFGIFISRWKKVISKK